MGEVVFLDWEGIVIVHAAGCRDIDKVRARARSLYAQGLVGIDEFPTVEAAIAGYLDNFGGPDNGEVTADQVGIVRKPCMGAVRMATEGNGQRAFVIYDDATGRKLGTFPLTMPIGATVEAFELAGFRVRWSWGELDLR